MEVEVVKEIEVNVEQIGPQGYSAYEVYVKNGGTLSETEWLNSLKTTLPNYSIVDAGKVLGISENGNLIWLNVNGEVVEPDEPVEPEEPTSYSVTYNLSNLTTNGVTTATNGTDYIATLTAESGYSLPTSIAVTIGGVNATHTYDSSTGKITIIGTNITGNIVITASGVEIEEPDTPTTYSITYNLSNSNDTVVATSENSISEIDSSTSYTNKLTKNDGVNLSAVQIKMGESDITDTAYNWETGEISIENVTGNISISATNDVDLGLFMGQSNMSGRGIASKATVCPEHKGYWYKQSTNDSSLDYEETTGLYPIIEPFGNEGTASTGSMVSAYCLNYYNNSGIPIVALANSFGGTYIGQWQSTSAGSMLYKGITKFTEAIEYLNNNGYNIVHKFMSWCQGETDGIGDESIGVQNTTREQYAEYFDAMRTTLKNVGVQDFFIIEIGQTKDASADYSKVRQAYIDVSREGTGDYADENTAIISDKFYGATSYMKDRWHYMQHAYNVVGKDAGIHMANYYANEPYTCEVWQGSEGEHEGESNYGSIEDYDYTISNSDVILNKYNGTDDNLYIYPYYEVDGTIYKTKFEYANNCIPTFKDNTSLVQVTFDNEVEPALVNKLTYLNNMFSGCSNLTTINNLPASDNIGGLFSGTAITECPELHPDTTATSWGTLFKDCSSLVVTPTIPSNITSMYGTFQNCTSLVEPPVIPDGVTTIQYCFNGCDSLVRFPDVPNSVTNMGNATSVNMKALTTVGRIGKGITNLSNTFRYCDNITGTIRIEAENISNVTNAFSTKAIPNITFEVPSDSTTYTTLTTAYPTANVTTFTVE